MIFTITKDHLLLLKHTYITENTMCYGSATIDPKRPYGAKNVIGSINEIVYGKNNVLSMEQTEYLEKLHNDMVTVLQIVLSTQSFKEGIYKEVSPFDWKLIIVEEK